MNIWIQSMQGFLHDLRDLLRRLREIKVHYFFSLLLLVLALPVFIIFLQKTQIMQKVDSSSPSVYYGAYTSQAYLDFSGISAFEADMGKTVAIVHGYTQWGRTDGVQNFNFAWADKVRAHGSIPMITWEPWSSGGANQPAFRLQNIYNGTYDAYITKWAKDSKTWGHPYFLRFAHEMNGNWYPWSEQVNGNKPGDYVKAWKHVHDIFVANGATNVTWVWSPSIETAAYTPLAELYPGDSYVDWVAMDGYNLGGRNWQTFSQVFGQTYSGLQQLAPVKPVMIAETSSEEVGGSKAAWITDAVTTQLPNKFPNIRALVWFNDNLGNGQDWRIESSSSSQQAFARAIASPYYASNQFGNLNSSPIPPLLLPGATTRRPPTPVVTPIQTSTPLPALTVTPTPIVKKILIQNDSLRRCEREL